MNNKKIALSILVLMTLYISNTPLISSIATDTGSVNIYSLEDTFVDTFMGTRVYGDWETLWIAREFKTSAFQEGWNHKDTLLKFDLSVIPADLEITSVTLNLYCLTFQGENVQFSSYHCSSNDWNEDTLNHGLYQLNVIEDIYDTGATETTVNEANSWYSIDITDGIEDFTGKTFTEVLKIVSNHMDRFVTFSSKEGDYQPYLEVTFEKYQSTLTCNPSQTEVPLGDAITINGRVTPSTTATLNIKYQSGDATEQRTKTTGTDGTYTDSYTPTEAGTWSITVEWQGTEYYSSAEESIEVTISSQPGEPTTPMIPGFPIEAILLSILITGLALAATRKHPLQPSNA